MPTPHVLLAWELGANLGHVTPLGVIARALVERGARVTFALQRLDAMRALRPLHPSWSVVQAPVWPGLLVTTGFRGARAPASLGDILANLGLRDSASVEFLLRGWDTLLTAVRPDAVVTDFAPMAQVAARNRIPVAAVGSGFALPPDHLSEFPPLRDARPTFPEHQLLLAVNLGLRKIGRAGLRGLPEMFAAERRLPHCFAIFDPYNALRQEPLLPPIVPGWTPTQVQDGGEVFVYFSETAPRAERMFEALARLGQRVRIHVPNLPASIAEQLGAAGVSVEPRPIPVGDIVRRSQLVVSHGGLGLISTTLAAGLPQLVLAPDLDKQLVGQSLMRLGVGRVLSWHAATPDGIVAAINELGADATVRGRALRLGADLQPLLKENSATQIADAALFLCAASGG